MADPSGRAGEPVPAVRRPEADRCAGRRAADVPRPDVPRHVSRPGRSAAMTARTEERPLRYVDGIALRPHAAGLDVVGGPRTARLTGAGEPTTTRLRIVELIRTGLPLPDVAERLGLPVDAVRAHVALLVRVGALTGAPPRRDAPPQMVRFLERSLGPAAAAAALDRLAAARVHLAGDERLCRAVAGRIRACGVRTVDAPATAPALVIRCAAPTPGDDPRADAPTPGDDLLADAPTLFLSTDADGAAVGPLCNVPGGRCPSCLPSPGQGPDPDQWPDPGQGADLNVDPTAGRLAVAHAVAEAVRHLARTGHCRTTGGVMRIGPDGRDISYEPVARDPACPRCGLPGAALPGAAVAAYRSLQAADVPLKANWSYPRAPLDASDADSTIKVLPVPGGRVGFGDRPDADRAVRIVARTLTTRHGRVPSVGGASLLNVFLCGRTGTGPSLYCLDQRHGTIRPVP